MRRTTAAFKYFINHYDRGRPFILVGHSLGSNVMANLLAQFMGTHPRIRERMVAAYVVGYSITRGYLTGHPFLEFAKGPNDTGVIVSWNTEAPTVDGTNPVLLPCGFAINPITWTRSETEAPAAQNLGSIQLDPATGGTPVMTTDDRIKRFPGLANARVDKKRGGRLQHGPRGPAPVLHPRGFPQGVLHPFDYPLYFFSVRVNVRDRVAHYFAGR